MGPKGEVNVILLRLVMPDIVRTCGEDEYPSVFFN